MKVKKICSVLLSFSMLSAPLSLAAPYETGIGSWNDLAAAIRHDGAYVLTANVTYDGNTDLILPAGNVVTLDLNGFVLDAAGEPIVDDATTFTDVPADAWYAEAVRWAQSVGIAKGYGDSIFAPDGSLTREMLCVFLYRYAQTQGNGFHGLWAFRPDAPDVSSVSDWAYESVCWMLMNGILQPENGSLSPAAPVTNAFVGEMLQAYQRFAS